MSYSFENVKSVETVGDNVEYAENVINSSYTYSSTKVIKDPSSQKLFARASHKTVQFQTQRHVPRVGVLLVGWGGNNGATVTAGILANKLGLSWNTKEGTQKANYYGSITQASTVRLGLDEQGNDVFVPFHAMVPMVDPNDFVIGGWDISKMNLGDAMRRSRVLDVNLQDQLYDHMKTLVPMPSIYR